MRWIICQIAPLARVFPHVVQLLAPVAVANVVVSLRANRVIHTVPMRRMCNDCRIRPFDGWITHQWSNATTVQSISLRKPTEISQRWVQVYETDRAIAAFEHARARGPRSPFVYIFLATTYAEAGREEEARAAVAELLKRFPKFSVKRIARALPYKDPAELKRIVVALRKAGLPE